MTISKPNSKTWILRCKIHKTTVLLYADPATSLTSLKKEFLMALNETHTDGTIETIAGPTAIPSSVDGVILGKMVDPNNSRRGWERMGDEVDDIGWSFSENSKGKAVAGKGRSQIDNSKVTVQSEGLADGAVVGVMFRGTADSGVAPTEPRGLQKDVWDIILPRLEPDDEDEAIALEEDDVQSEIDIPVPSNAINS